MTLSEKCSACRGKLVEKEIEKFLKSNGDTAVLKVKVEVCLRCGMRFYAPEAIKRIIEVNKKFKKGQTKGFILTGKSYKIA